MQAKLKSILFEQGISQKNLAKEIGISEHSMSDKMHGRIDFTYTEVYKLCRVLDIENPLKVFEPKKEERDALTSRSVGIAI